MSPNDDSRAAARRHVEDAIARLKELRLEAMFGGQWVRIDAALESLRIALSEMQEKPGP